MATGFQLLCPYRVIRLRERSADGQLYFYRRVGGNGHAQGYVLVVPYLPFRHNLSIDRFVFSFGRGEPTGGIEHGTDDDFLVSRCFRSGVDTGHGPVHPFGNGAEGVVIK